MNKVAATFIHSLISKSITEVCREGSLTRAQGPGNGNHSVAVERKFNNLIK